MLINCDYFGTSYGGPAHGKVEALNMLARLEGTFLDPVYSRKGIAKLNDLVRKKTRTAEQDNVFRHGDGHVGPFNCRIALSPVTWGRGACTRM